MVSTSKRVVTAALCALLSLSPLLGCASTAQNQGNDAAGQEELVKEDEQAKEGKTVPYSRQGAYTVTLNEGDFTKAEEAQSDSAATSEQSATSGEDEPAAQTEQTEQTEQTAENAEAAEQQAHESESDATQSDAEAISNADAASDQEQAVEGQEEETKEAPQAATQEEQQTRPAFGDVKAEDVKVYYFILTNAAELEAADSAEAEPQYEEREAKVDSFANDNGAITLSFTDSDAASNLTSSYCVTIDALNAYATIGVDMTAPELTAESGVASDSESSDVTIKAQNATFATTLSASDLTLGGSFEGMSITGAEAAGDTLTVHLSGTPAADDDASSTVMDGQITVAASGFENSPADATAPVTVNLPEEAFDLGDEEALSPTSALGAVDYVSFDGETVKATLLFFADLGTFNDVTPQSITLEDSFAAGKVESVSKEGENNDTLKVEVSFPANGQSEDDYVFAGTLKFAAGAMSDENGNSAPEVASTVALYPEEDMGKDAASDAAKKAKDTKVETLKGGGEAVKYAKGWLEKVDPTLGVLADFGSETLNLVANITAGKWSDVVKNGIGYLKILGLTTGEKEVTAKDVLKEVQGLRQLVSSLDLKVSDISRENREDRYTQTSVRLKKMQDATFSAQAMFIEAANILETRKENPMKAPGENASNEEVVKYNTELRNIMLKEQKNAKDGNSATTMFYDVDTTMNSLMDDLSTVTKWVMIEKGSINAGANPIDVLDKLVAAKFNWETQGYHARAAFRGELEYTLLDAWAVLSTYYNFTDPAVAMKYQPQVDNMEAALKQIEARPAGQTPDQVRELNRAGKEIKVYSPSLGYTIKRSKWCEGGRDASVYTSDERTSNDRISEYQKRMQGGIWDDIEMAGLDVGTKDRLEGLGFRHHVSRETSRPFGMGDYGKTFDMIETWTLMIHTDKSISAKRTFRGTQYYGEPLKGDVWWRFIWFERA